jgi:hypothetical protein
MIPQTTGAEARPSVRRIEAVEGRAFEIDVGGKHDVLLLRGEFAETRERVETARMASDFELAWARFANARARTPEELVLIGGQTLELGGREMLKSGKRIDYLSISNLGDEVRLETEQEVFNIRPSTGDLESLLARFNQ